MKYIKAFLLIFFLVILFTVTVQNYNEECLAAPVLFRVDLWVLKYQTTAISLGSLAVVSFLLGVIIMGSVGMIERFRLKKQIKTLLAEARERDKELNSLRNLPVTTAVIEAETTSDTE